MIQDAPPAAVSPHEDVESLTRAGLAARRAGDQMEAVRLLSHAARLAPHDADVLLYYGLALMDAGRLDDARSVLDRAAGLAPDYADVTMARARLAVRRGSPAEARALAGPLARRGHAEAMALLREPGQDPVWRADLWASHGSMDAGPDWRAAGAALSRRLPGRATAALSVEWTERFGLTDTYAEATLGKAVGDGQVWAAVGGAASADYRAELSMAVGGQAPLRDLGGGSLDVIADARWSRYPAGAVFTARPGLVWSSDRARVEARWIRTRDETARWRDGWMLRGAVAVKPDLWLDAVAADAPESDSGRTLDVRAVGGGVRLDLDDALSVRLGYLQEERGALGDRRELTAALTRRF